MFSIILILIKLSILIKPLNQKHYDEISNGTVGGHK